MAEGRCTACGRCREACPQGGARPVDGNADSAVPPSEKKGTVPICRDGPEAGTIDRWSSHKWRPSPFSTSCIRCGACVDACPSEARQLVGRRMTVAEVLAEIVKDRIFYDDSRGGATFSGGEPFAQPEFLLALLAACRRREIHTAVDTSGYVDPEDLLASARWTDLFLYDLKILDDARHRRYTGVSNRDPGEPARPGPGARNIWVRMPLVPGVNDARRDLEDVVRLAASVPGVRQVNLLPYHATGAAKFARLGKTYLRRRPRAAAGRVRRTRRPPGCKTWACRSLLGG